MPANDTIPDNEQSTAEHILWDKAMARLLATSTRMEVMVDTLERLVNRLDPDRNPKPLPPVKIWITEYLQATGVPTHILGFRYLQRAILYAINHPEWRENGVIKNLYPKLAPDLIDKLTPNTISLRVERCIRHAIHRAYGEAESPDNSEFIAQVVTEWEKILERHNAAR